MVWGWKDNGGIGNRKWNEPLERRIWIMLVLGRLLVEWGVIRGTHFGTYGSGGFLDTILYKERGLCWQKKKVYSKLGVCNQQTRLWPHPRLYFCQVSPIFEAAVVFLLVWRALWGRPILWTYVNSHFTFTVLSIVTHLSPQFCQPIFHRPPIARPHTSAHTLFFTLARSFEIFSAIHSCLWLIHSGKSYWMVEPVLLRSLP